MEKMPFRALSTDIGLYVHKFLATSWILDLPLRRIIFLAL